MVTEIRSPLEQFLQREARHPDKRYLVQPLPGGQVQSLTWGEAGDQARRAAAWLRSLQLPPGSRVAIISKNCAHWIIADVAIYCGVDQGNGVRIATGRQHVASRCKSHVQVGAHEVVRVAVNRAVLALGGVVLRLGDLLLLMPLTVVPRRLGASANEHPIRAQAFADEKAVTSEAFGHIHRGTPLFRPAHHTPTWRTVNCFVNG